jgi:hypothetical protein
MTTSIPTVQEVQDQVIAAVRKSQEATIDAIKGVVDAVSSVTTKLPGTPEKLSVPFAGKLPTPEALVAGAYDFAGQLLAEQRKFAEDILKATAPLRPTGSEAPAAEAPVAEAPAAKPAPRTHSKPAA